MQTWLMGDGERMTKNISDELAEANRLIGYPIKHLVMTEGTLGKIEDEAKGHTSKHLPMSIKIVDIIYTVQYVDKVGDVDTFGRESLAGQVDFFKRNIRIHAGDRRHDDIRQTLWHEILHAICERLRIQNNQLQVDENAIDLLAIGVNVAMEGFNRDPR